SSRCLKRTKLNPRIERLGPTLCSRPRGLSGKPDWRAHDAKKIADLTAPDISFINIFGFYLATKTDALQDWSGTYCDVKSVSLTDATGTTLSPMVGILTFKARADGTCYGQKVGPV